LKKGSEAMDKSEWMFFRLRMVNFPTLRIAYLSGILNEIIQEGLFKKLVTVFENNKFVKEEINKIFKKIKFSNYWIFYYNFGKKKKTKSDELIGEMRINDILINVIIPLILLYAMTFKKSELKSQVLNYYESIKSNFDNEITRVIKSELDIKTKLESENQGMIHLYNYYCLKGRCKDCDIGKFLYHRDFVYEPLKIIIY